MKRVVFTSLLLLLALAWAAPATAAEEAAATAGETSPAIAARDSMLMDAFNGIMRAQALTDQRLGDISIALLALRETGDVKSLDFAAMLPALAALQAHLPGSVVWFALPDGTYYTVDGGRMEQSLADRAYFPELLDGCEVIGEVVVSKAAGKPAVIIAEPVYVDSAVAGALGVSLLIEGEAARVADGAQWPEDIGLRVLAPDGQLLFTLGDTSQPVSELVIPSSVTGWQYQLLMEDVHTYVPGPAPKPVAAPPAAS